jgi:hypothetical protein
MTPAELVERLNGYEWRERRSWEKLAWQTAHHVNISGKYVKRRIRPKDLLAGSGGHDPIAHWQKMQQLKDKLEKRKQH